METEDNSKENISSSNIVFSSTEKKNKFILKGVDFKKKFKFFLSSLFFVFIIFIIFLYNNYVKPPFDFPAGEIITIESGQNSQQVANFLEQKKVISKKEFLVLSLVIQKLDSKIVAGDYLFSEPINIFEVSNRIGNGQYGDTRIRITISEGMANFEIANLLDEKIPNFDKEKFLELATLLEGYLFPDTYLVFPSIEEEEFLEMMRTNFENKTVYMQNLAQKNNKKWSDVIIMASLIEKEAFARDRREHFIISGILWKRIEIGMPLQVDAPFRYLLGKSSSELTLNDLKIDSPYNTYVNKGLPVGPINNPGLLSIESAILPEKSPYLFYLHDKNGQIYYAENHEKHVQNKKLYLN